MNSRKVHKPHKKNNTIWVISLSLIIITVLIGGYLIISHVQENSQEQSNKAYHYAMNNILVTAQQQEITARSNLQSKIDYANTLLNDTNGKIFDSSRPNLQNQLVSSNIALETKTPNSNDYHEYIKTTNILQNASRVLQQRIDALQDSYDSWNESHNISTTESAQNQESINSKTSQFSSLEDLILSNAEDLNETEEERQQRINEAQRQAEIARQNQAAQESTPTPTASPTKPTVSPTTPVEAPTTTEATTTAPTTVNPTTAPTPAPTPTTTIPSDPPTTTPTPTTTATP